MTDTTTTTGLDSATTLHGYSSLSLERAMLAAFARGLQNRRDSDRDTLDAASGDTAAAHRQAIIQLADARTSATILKTWTAHYPIPTTLRQLVTFTEVYARAHGTEALVDLAAQHIDTSIHSLPDPTAPPGIRIPTLGEIDNLSQESWDDRAYRTPDIRLNIARAHTRITQLEHTVSITTAAAMVDARLLRARLLRARALDGLAPPGTTRTPAAPTTRKKTGRDIVHIHDHAPDPGR